MPNSLLAELREMVRAEADQMTDVATGGPRIDDVKDVYRQRRERIAKLCSQLGLPDQNPHDELWDWYHHWSTGSGLGTYNSRRVYVRGLVKPLLDAIDTLESQPLGTGLPDVELTGWDAVRSQVDLLKQRVASCDGTDDSQAVALLCRELFITLAESAYRPELHGPTSNSAVDKLNLVIEAEADGSSNRALRKLLKATVDYANKVQHQRTATPKKAGICAEATIAGVHLIRRLTEDEGEPSRDVTDDLNWPPAPTPPPPSDDDVPF